MDIHNPLTPAERTYWNQLIRESEKVRKEMQRISDRMWREALRTPRVNRRTKVA
jgi:hypothetical protein